MANSRKTGSAGSSDVHVSPLISGWEVRRSGERYPTSKHRTRLTAVRMARALAADSRSQLIVHGIDGTSRIEATEAAPIGVGS